MTFWPASTWRSALPAWFSISELLRSSLLKIDTEGTEQECLIGGERTLRTLQPVIVIEYNSLSQARPGHDDMRMLYLLRDLGYRMFLPKPAFWRQSARRFQEMTLEASLDNSLINVVCLPPARTDLVAKVLP